ncbi:ATP-binding protein [Micromonospora sp. WMMC241]|uniref:ATP-binding protein n=1 Tax=Micromonospora sp. WMMC241 TaxID=3015159 RepID=UPI0022B5EED8|nr:ATP-binding protein [Micromonospora sp. WMMC241]MCZ7437114.1 ATP-binding protein [Micromonospora sp. WMMC241]
MRGPLWRGWLWTPRTWVEVTFRRAATWYTGRSQEEWRLAAARPAAPARWWHQPWWWYALAAVVSVTLLVWAATQFLLPLIYVVFGADWATTPLGPGRWLGDSCGTGDAQCKKISGFLATLFPFPLALALFYLFTRLRVYPAYQRIARQEPERLVSTSNDVLADVVGREELCEVLIERVRDPDVRCPMVLVGGVGAGKSAVLVKLAHELADRGIVPIVLRARELDVTLGVDFEKEAQHRFTDLIDPNLYSGGQADRLWRQLRWGNKVAVLVDGLEEVGRTEGHGDEGRHDSVLRDAFTKAADNRLPLVATTRPYDPLRSMPAVIVGLEPLSEGHALTFGLGEDERVPGPALVARLVADADATESPLYLKVIRDLHRFRRLPEGLGGPPGPGQARRPVDRSAVRLELLRAWRSAVVEGYVCEDFSHDPDERRHALDLVSAFACVGVLRDSLDVSYDEVEGWKQSNHQYHFLCRAVERRIGGGLDLDERADLVTAVTTAGEFSVIGLEPRGLRFQHGVVQAFLAEQLLTAPGVYPRMLDESLRGQPSKEMLIALTLWSREGERSLRSHGSRLRSLRRFVGPAEGDPVGRLVHRLVTQARQEPNKCWQLEMYGAALEIDTSADPPAHNMITEDIQKRWPTFEEGDLSDRPLDEAKLSLVRRWGDAARLIGDRRRRPTEGPYVEHAPGYDSLFRLARQERSYRVRLAAAREIGTGGEPATRALHAVGGLGPLHLDADADESAAWEQQVRGWAAPLLHLSTQRDTEAPTGSPAAEESERYLRDWLRELAAHRPTGGGRRIHLAGEIALAQGFRLAANVRQLPLGRPNTDRSFLIEKAEEALTHARFWYSHLVLIQSLTLLSLPLDPREPLPPRGHGANPVGLVQHWLRLAGSGVPDRERCDAHPFLRAAGRLCVSALVTRQPERFCWIDEAETASRVGSCCPSPEVRHLQRLWIPDSMGWSVLKPPAERLLADVMVLLNLADRGATLGAREERLRRADRCDLPPCLTSDRGPLQPNRSVHREEPCAPGGTCLDDCAFRLCPLPAKGEPLRYRMDQNFCARQADLASWWYALRARAPWQSVPTAGSQRFWRQMSWRDLPRWRRW